MLNWLMAFRGAVEWITQLLPHALRILPRLQGIKAWTRLNGLFNWLPLAASIEDRVLCMHGGIGRSIHSVEQIEELQVGQAAAVTPAMSPWR